MASTLLGRAIDAPLDANGQAQAQALAGALRTRGTPMIEASPRLRTQQTAAAIAAHIGTSVSIVAELDEVNFGAWAGRTFAELASDPDWRRWNSRRSDAATPAGERISHVQMRLLEHLRRLCAAFPGRSVILVTHAEVIRSILLHWLDASLDAYDRLEIAPASWTRIEMDRERVLIDGINRRVDA
jgi:broad specificity phosphatase PhoE